MGKLHHYLCLWCLQLCMVVCWTLDASHGKAERFECTRPGNYSVGGSCSAYIECRMDSTFQEEEEGKEEGRNGLVDRPILLRGPTHLSCGQHLAFSPILNRCIDETLVKGCNKSSTSIDDRQLIPNPSLDFVCQTNPNQYICANCKTLVNCVDGKAYPQVCNPGDFCFNRIHSFGGPVCYPGNPKKCLCKENNVFYQDKYNQEVFFICDNAGNTHLHYCPEGYEFDEEALECRSATGLPTCTGSGVFALPEDCRRYYACIATKSGWLQYEFHCPANHGILMYNEETDQCENPCNWKNPIFTCTDEGRFADPLDCRRFYVCTWDKLTNRFRKVQRQCPNGYEWQEILRSSSGRCTTMITEECAPVVTSRCHIPEGTCP